MEFRPDGKIQSLPHLVAHPHASPAAIIDDGLGLSLGLRNIKLMEKVT
jgi:hypothetical protein